MNGDQPQGQSWSDALKAMGGIKGAWEMLINLIIRPPRLEYHINDLGPTSFGMGGRLINREDFRNKK